jgi:hypothetical protein
MARVLIAGVLAVACIAASGSSFVAAARAETPHAKSLTSFDANVGAFPTASYGSVGEPRHVTSNFLRPHYGSLECATDAGDEYRWPCNRPGSQY